MTKITYPLTVPAIRVEQPIGSYFVAVLPARVLLDVAYSDRMSATLNADGLGYRVDGTQRLKDPKRLTQITDYIDRSDSAFPNSIILAANFDQATGLTEDVEAEDDEAQSEANANEAAKTVWRIETGEDGCEKLVIPSAVKLAALIDGQHRLFSFANANPDRLDMELICAIFLDLPKPFQAQLFATINSTQKPVDKSLTYELFGYNVSEESAQHWTPDKLAVFLTRKLNTEDGSPLKGRVVVAPKRDAALMALNTSVDWKISTAVVVEGIMRLYSSNPKRDTNEMLTPPIKTRDQLREKAKDKSPLREVYLDGNDAIMYALVLNFLKACQTVFWNKASPSSYIVKTIGVQALMDILRKISSDAYSGRDVSVGFFQNILEPAGAIDFAADPFKNASGAGRSSIRRAIEQAIGL